MLHIQNGFLPPIYSNEWRDNGGNMTVNLRPRPNLSVLTATTKRIKIFFTLLGLFGFSYLTFSFENVYLWWVQFSPIIHIKTPKNVNRGEGMFHVIVFKSRCFTRSHKKPKAILFWSRCHERFSSVLVWIISKNAPKSIGRLFQRGLTQIAVLRKQWASIIPNKRVDFIKPMSFLYWLSALLTLFTKINVEIKDSARLKIF